MIHTHTHPLAGKTVTVDIDGQERPYRLEDWWDRVYGQSWKTSDGNPAALGYAMRTGLALAAGNPVPPDDEVVYGKIGSLGYLVHVSEIKTEEPA